jgi:formate hydrogenlyase subunit 6/NADH:ubiquinone oxidoreductase subunit I
VTSANQVDNKYEVQTYRVDSGYCIQCGLCVEACPYDAVFLGYSFERAKYRRDELVQSNDALLESPERPVSGYFHPGLAEKLPEQTLLVEKIVEKRQ